MPGVRCCRLFIRTQHRIRYSHSAAHSRPAQKYGSTHIYTFASIFASGTIASLLWARWRSPLRLDERTRDIKSGKVAIPQDERFISAEELAKHTTPDSLWVVVDQRVWDVTDFLDKHPGGSQYLTDNAGKDVSAIFAQIHPPGTLSKTMSALKAVGPIEASAKLEEVGNTDLQDQVERRSELLDVSTVLNLDHFETLAKQVLGPNSRGWLYMSSYADDGNSYRTSRDAYSFVRFVPRVLVPVSLADLTAKFFDTKSSLPFYFAPTGSSKMAHPNGEKNLTAVAAATGVPQCVSNVASVPLSEILGYRDELEKEGKGRANIWFQLYTKTDREISERDLKQAAAGDVGAILFTVDTVVLGNREADRAKVARPDVVSGSMGGSKSAAVDADLSWNDISWIKSIAPKQKVLLKGVASVEDIILAKQRGADGVVLSNHGGRQLDYAPPPLAVLARLNLEQPSLLKDKAFEVYIDGGIRRGTDVLKALCLGAKGVSLGRPILYAQACYGQEGIERACQIMSDEISRGMRLLGVTKIDQLKPEMIEIMDGLLGRTFTAQKPET